MARLLLKFENATLKEFPLTRGSITIGRLPDNVIQVDNPAVSGHHARVYWETDHFVIEDSKSFNGTYVNDQRIARQALRDNDTILVGKHTLSFKAEPQQEVGAASTAVGGPALPSLDSTAMLDTKKARELMAHASAKAGAAAAVAASTPAVTGAFEGLASPPPPPAMRLGVLSVIAGNTDQSQYVLTGKLTVIGKSDMASIRLKGWFAPKVAGAISRREDHYFLAPTGKKITVNGFPVGGQTELQAGDMITVGKVRMTFGYNE